MSLWRVISLSLEGVGVISSDRPSFCLPHLSFFSMLQLEKLKLPFARSFC